MFATFFTISVRNAQADSLYELASSGELDYNSAPVNGPSWTVDYSGLAALSYRSPNLSGSGTEVDGSYQYSGSAQASLMFDHGVFSGTGAATAATNNLDFLATTTGVGYARFGGNWYDTLTVSGVPANTPVDLLLTMTLKSKTGGNTGLDSSASTINAYAYITPSPQTQSVYLATRNGSGNGLQTASQVFRVVAGEPLQLTDDFYVDADANNWETYGEVDPPNGPLGGVKVPSVSEYIDAPDATSINIQVLTPDATLSSASGLTYAPESDVPEPSSFRSIALASVFLVSLQWLWRLRFRTKFRVGSVVVLAFIGFGWRTQADPLFGFSSSAQLQLLTNDPGPAPGWDTGGYQQIYTYQSPSLSASSTIHNFGYDYGSSGQASLSFDHGIFFGNLSAQATTTDDRPNGEQAFSNSTGNMQGSWFDTLTITGPTKGSPVSLRLSIVFEGGVGQSQLTNADASATDEASLQRGSESPTGVYIRNTLDFTNRVSATEYQAKVGDVLHLENSVAAYAYADTSPLYTDVTTTSSFANSEIQMPMSVTVDVLTDGDSFRSASGLTYGGGEAGPEIPEPPAWGFLLLGVPVVWFMHRARGHSH